jgi:hypothetical protein
MDIMINITKKRVLFVFGGIFILAALTFAIAQIPNPGHDVSEIFGAQVDLNPNSCSSGKVLKGVNNDGSLVCVTDQVGGAGGGSGCNLHHQASSGTNSFAVPSACLGKVCNILVSSDSSIDRVASFRYIQQVPGISDSRRWMIEGGMFIDSSFASSSVFVSGGLNGVSEEVLVDGGSVDNDFILYDDFGGEFSSTQWTLQADLSSGVFVRVYVC